MEVFTTLRYLQLHIAALLHGNLVGGSGRFDAGKPGEWFCLACEEKAGFIGG